MASKIVPLIPPHTVYCEPFAGGAAVFYAKPKPNTSGGSQYREVLNDINGQLVNMYRVAMSSPRCFTDSVLSIPFAAAIHRGAKCDYSSSKASAVAYYATMKQSFGNQFMGGWARGTIGQNWAYDYQKSMSDCQQSAERLKSVYLDSICALKCIDRWDSPQTFFYVDPPYIDTCTKGLGKWLNQDLENLVDRLNAAKGSWILSEYAPVVRGLNCQFIKAVHAHAGLGSGRTWRSRNHGEKKSSSSGLRIEHLHMRGPAAPVRKSLIPVLQRQTCFTGPLLGPCPLPLDRKTP